MPARHCNHINPECLCQITASSYVFYTVCMHIHMYSIWSKRAWKVFEERRIWFWLLCWLQPKKEKQLPCSLYFQQAKYWHIFTVWHPGAVNELVQKQCQNLWQTVARFSTAQIIKTISSSANPRAAWARSSQFVSRQKSTPSRSPNPQKLPEGDASIIGSQVLFSKTCGILMWYPKQQ